jgi:hypothetical protein
MSTEQVSTFQQIAVPRIRAGMAAGLVLAAAAALFVDPANAASLALFGGGAVAGTMFGLMIAVMTSEPIWKEKH